MSRIFLYPKDLSILTGRTEKQARKTYETIKQSLGKQEHQKITIEEYATYEGIAVEEIIKNIGK